MKALGLDSGSAATGLAVIPFSGARSSPGWMRGAAGPRCRPRSQTGRHQSYQWQVRDGSVTEGSELPLARLAGGTAGYCWTKRGRRAGGQRGSGPQRGKNSICPEPLGHTDVQAEGPESDWNSSWGRGMVVQKGEETSGMSLKALFTTAR